MYVQQHKHEILQYSWMLTSTWILLFYIISNSGRYKYFTKISVSPNIFFLPLSTFLQKNVFVAATLCNTRKNARFARARNFARARRAPKIFWKKFEFIEGLNICKIRMAGKVLVRPENGLPHGISRFLPNMTRKNHINLMWWDSINQFILELSFPILFFRTNSDTKL